MNKKYLLMFGIIGMFAVALISAGILQYYGTHQETIDITQPITVGGELSGMVTCYAGDVCEGEAFTIINAGITERTVLVDNDADETEIEVSYVGQLTLTKKDTTTWEAEGEPILVDYTIIGDTFTATTEADCTLIYYKDNEANVDDAERMLTLGDIGIGGNLPHSNDWNAVLPADYCSNADNYDACRGAKLWCVQSENIDGDEFVWSNPQNIYFETNLIQFNSDGELIIYPGQTLTLTPMYSTNPLLEDGDYIVNTTVNPTA